MTAKKIKNDNDSREEGQRITYTDDVIKERFRNYGTVYFPSDINETIEDIIGNEIQKESLDDFFKALRKYEEFKEQLKRTNLNPNFTVLLYGPPGTGKTSLTRAFAKKYDIPICVVESDRLVSSLLGDNLSLFYMSNQHRVYQRYQVTT